MIEENRIQEAYDKRNELLMYGTFYPPKFFNMLINKIEEIYFEMKSIKDSDLTSKNELEEKKSLLTIKLDSKLYKCVTTYKDKEVFKTNTGISVFHPLFQDVAIKIDLFQNLDQNMFNSIDEVLVYLNK